MAYSSTNPPHLLVQGVGGRGPNIWAYRSSDAIATVCGSSYISDGWSRGMKAGDIVNVLNTASTLGSQAYVSNVTAGAGATLLSSFTTT